MLNAWDIVEWDRLTFIRDLSEELNGIASGSTSSGRQAAPFRAGTILVYEIWVRVAIQKPLENSLRSRLAAECLHSVVINPYFCVWPTSSPVQKVPDSAAVGKNDA